MHNSQRIEGSSLRLAPCEKKHLEAVVQTYDTRQALGLTAAQAADLVQYLKSL